MQGERNGIKLCKFTIEKDKDISIYIYQMRKLSTKIITSVTETVSLWVLLAVEEFYMHANSIKWKFKCKTIKQQNEIKRQVHKETHWDNILNLINIFKE